MFLRLLRDSFLRRRRRKLLAVTALALGTGVTMASLSVALDIGDKVARELRSFGANILVRPQADTLPIEIGGVDLRPLSEGSFLDDRELPKLKAIFWRHHILAFSPFLHQSARLSPLVAGQAGGEPVVLVGVWFEKSLAIDDGTTFTTGLAELTPGWELTGGWPADTSAPEAVAGAALAERFGWRAGDGVALQLIAGRQASLNLRGVLRTGGDEDRQLFVPLAWLQEESGRSHAFRQLQVSALVSPEDEFARRDPASMTPVEFDRWYCTPYVSSIAHQIQEVLPGTEATPVHRVAQAETAVLSRVERLLTVVSAAALLAAVLVVLSTMTTVILERRTEIALMKALGAESFHVAALFLTEAALLGLLGGALGYAGGLAGADLLARGVFGASVTAKPVLLPVMLALATGASLVGTFLPLRDAQRTDPAVALREK
ncbi:MAG: ABC transporter permease [Candidatus Acidiferrales bacterium]